MITGSINLTALQCAVKEVNAKGGRKVKAIIIPLEQNYLEQHANGSVYFNFAAWEKETQYSTHYLTHSLKKDVREKLKADGIQLPIMGNMTIKNEEYQPPVNTTANIDLPQDDGDDLPF